MESRAQKSPVEPRLRTRRASEQRPVANKKLTILASVPARLGPWLGKVLMAAEAAGLDLDGFPEPTACRLAEGHEELMSSMLGYQNK